jgi:hypothetical protein
MSAGGALQSAIALSLASVEELTGVYDGPPARAGYPYVALDATTETDWSHKNGDGREARETGHRRAEHERARAHRRRVATHQVDKFRLKVRHERLRSHSRSP